MDIMNFKEEGIYDIILAHLFLGESSKFMPYKSTEMVDRLLEIPSNYLVIVDIEEDKDVDWNRVKQKIEFSRKIIAQDKIAKYAGFVAE